MHRHRLSSSVLATDSSFVLDKLRGICLTKDVSWRYLLDTLLIITSMILSKKEGRGVRFVTGAGKHVQESKLSNTMLVSVTNVIPQPSFFAMIFTERCCPVASRLSWSS